MVSLHTTAKLIGVLAFLVHGLPVLEWQLSAHWWTFGLDQPVTSFSGKIQFRLPAYIWPRTVKTKHRLTIISLTGDGALVGGGVAAEVDVTDRETTTGWPWREREGGEVGLVASRVTVPAELHPSSFKHTRM